MKKIKLLLLNLDPEQGSGKELQQLLETSESETFEIKHKFLVEGDLPNILKRLSPILSSCSSDLAFFIFGANAPPYIPELFRAFRASKSSQPVIAIVNTGEQAAISEVLYHGANDFLIPPFRAINVLPRVWRWAEAARQEDASTRTLKKELGLGDFVGDNPAFLAEITKIPAVARSDANVLIGGETGTGKEICARAIHFLSRRVTQPLIAVNCGATPAELLGNELFGHESGAFTSATTSSEGLIRAAEGGTLFLDEIDALPLLAQAKLLRFLQEKEFRPLGSQKTFKSNLRVIAAANVNLEAAVKAGRFRQDLYYRLNVINITLPPLRQRAGDIPLLARFFIARFTTEVGQPSKGLTPAAMQKLALYEWPGNVRQLKHVIEHSVVLSEHTMIEGAEIMLPQSTAATGDDCFQVLKAITMADFEHKYISQLLEANKGNITKAAQAAGIDRRGLRRMIQKHKIPLPARNGGNSPG